MCYSCSGFDGDLFLRAGFGEVLVRGFGGEAWQVLRAGLSEVLCAGFFYKIFSARFDEVLL